MGTESTRIRGDHRLLLVGGTSILITTDRRPHLAHPAAVILRRGITLMGITTTTVVLPLNRTIPGELTVPPVMDRKAIPKATHRGAMSHTEVRLVGVVGTLDIAVLVLGVV
jgi:hypothetical protein